MCRKIVVVVVFTREHESDDRVDRYTSKSMARVVRAGRTNRGRRSQKHRPIFSVGSTQRGRMSFHIALVLSRKFMGQGRTEEHVSLGIMTGTSQTAENVVLWQEQKICTSYVSTDNNMQCDMILTFWVGEARHVLHYIQRSSTLRGWSCAANSRR